MERDSIDGPYMVYIIDRLPMTLECVLLLLDLGIRIEVLH